MKNLKLDRNKIITIIFVLLAIVILTTFIIALELNNKNNQKNKLGVDDLKGSPTIIRKNPYKNAKKISSENLSKEHCLNNICVKNAIIYELDNIAKIEMTLKNTKSKKQTGFLKMNFGEQHWIIHYKDLDNSKEKKFIIQLEKERVIETSDYTLTELSEEEKSKIVVD